jgi:hypothetical protein
MANNAERAFHDRIAREVREAERLRRDAADINRRIWDEARLTEKLMARIRLRWLREGRDEEASNHAHEG